MRLDEARERRQLGAADDGRVVGAEALIRWQDPDNGLVMPGGIIPVIRSNTLNWKFETQPEPGCAKRRMFWPRGEEVAAVKNVTLQIRDLGTDLVDGQYNYELRLVPKVSKDLEKKLQAARAANDEKAARKRKWYQLTAAGERRAWAVMYAGRLVHD